MPLIILQDAFCLIIQSLISSGSLWCQGSSGSTCCGFPGKDLKLWCIPGLAGARAGLAEIALSCLKDNPVVSLLPMAWLLPLLEYYLLHCDSGPPSPCQTRQYSLSITSAHLCVLAHSWRTSFKRCWRLRVEKYCEQTGKKWPFTGIFSGNWQHCCTALTVLAGLFLFDAMKHDRSLEVLVLGDFFCCSFETMQSKGFI